MSRGSYDRRAPSASSQIICLERLLEEAEAENERLRRSVDSIVDSIKIRSYELGQRELHDMALAALKENSDER